MVIIVSLVAPFTLVWNNLANELKGCTNLNIFKHKTKEYFLNKTER